MAGPSPDTGDAATPDRSDGMPRWVKVFGIIGIVVALLIVIVLLVGDGSHGPGRHLPGGDASRVETPQRHVAVSGIPDHG